MRAAYVTTLCNGDGYLPGVEALGRSLDRSGTTHVKVVLVTDDVSDEARQRAQRAGFRIVDVAPIENPHPRDRQLYHRFESTFTKLRAFALTDYDKIILLDADTLVLRNIDVAFERPALAAAPDFLLPDRFNSGVLVIEPSVALFARLTDALATCASYDGGDQGFLNLFFRDWYRGPEGHRLPAGYNLPQFIYQFLRAHPQLEPLASEAKVLHYTVQKPWLAKSTLVGASEIWWEMYFEARPEAATGFWRTLHAAEDWSYSSVVRFLGAR